MENKTIQEILQKKLIRGSFVEGGFLYSPLFGKCTLKSANKDLFLERRNPFRPSVADTLGLRPDGKFSDDGECMVYPSPGMRDWNKFAWEEYTLLKSSNGKPFVFFECWEGKDYTKFKGISFRTKGGELRRVVKKYDTSKFMEVDEESAKAFYVTLYIAAKHSIPELEEMVPLYRSVVFEIHKQAFNRALNEFENLGEKSTREEKNNQGRAALEKLSENTSANDFKFQIPVKGKLYYFEDANKEEVSFIAQFNHFSVNKKVAFFDRSVMSAGRRNVLYADMSRKTETCLKFREATDEEENKFGRVIEEFKNSLVNFVEGSYYAFCIEDDFCYFGKLVSFKEDRSIFTLCEVYCAHRGNKPQYFEEKKFITSHCKNLRVATTEDKFFFDGVKASYDENRKDSLQFKPKDWCLMRYGSMTQWVLCQFAYQRPSLYRKEFVAVGGQIYRECIPYEGNEQLLGTSKSLDDGK